MKASHLPALGFACLLIACASGCAHDGMVMRRIAPPQTSLGWNNPNMRRYNLADELRAKDPSLTPKQAADKADALIGAQPEGWTPASYDTMKRQQQYAAQDAFAADLAKSQRGD